MGTLGKECSDNAGSAHRRRDSKRCQQMLRFLIIFLTLLTGLVGNYAAFSASIKGYATVIDGDSPHQRRW